MRILPALALSLTAAFGCSCVYARLDGSTEPSRAFDQPELGPGWQQFEALAKDHPGDTALLPLGHGLDAFAARAALIDRAEQAIDAQYYIFHDDLTGRYLLHRMLCAADRGVRVRLLLDDLGTSGIDDVLAAANAHPELEVRLFNPRARGSWPWLAKTLDIIWRPRRINRRMHNKLLSTDGLAVIIGGRNIGNEYFGAAESVNFGDLDLLAIGPVAKEAGESFDLYWNSSLTERLDGWKPFDRDEDDLAEMRKELESDAERARESEYAARLTKVGFGERAERGELPLIWASARAIADLPWKVIARGDEVEATMLVHRLGDALPTADHDFLIVSPYFIPRASGSERLLEYVASGVRVRVLTNSLAATDVPIVHAAYKRYRKELLEGGVEIYELMPAAEVAMESHRKGMFGSSSASLHAKTYIVDERHIFVGSLNLDPRSIELNTELGLVIDSPALSREIIDGTELAMQPSSSWRLSLTDGKLEWHGVRDGEVLVLGTEPDSSWWTRSKLWWMGILPIEGQL